MPASPSMVSGIPCSGSIPFFRRCGGTSSRAETAIMRMGAAPAASFGKSRSTGVARSVSRAARSLALADRDHARVRAGVRAIRASDPADAVLVFLLADVGGGRSPDCVHRHAGMDQDARGRLAAAGRLIEAQPAVVSLMASTSRGTAPPSARNARPACAPSSPPRSTAIGRPPSVCSACPGKITGRRSPGRHPSARSGF